MWQITRTVKTLGHLWRHLISFYLSGVFLHIRHQCTQTFLSYLRHQKNIENTREARRKKSSRQIGVTNNHYIVSLFYLWCESWTLKFFVILYIFFSSYFYLHTFSLCAPLSHPYIIRYGHSMKMMMMFSFPFTRDITHIPFHFAKIIWAITTQTHTAWFLTL